MLPSQTFFQEKFTLIRPLAFADEDLIRRFSGDSTISGFCKSMSNCQNVKTPGNKIYIKAALSQQ
jgi:hypothetical protein